MAEEGGSGDSGPNRIVVYMRVRPPNANELQWYDQGLFKPILRDEDSTPEPEKRIIVDKAGKSYEFDRVFRDGSSQTALFKAAAIPTLENVFAGYCGAVMAYGQTGTGKTHTMQGYAERMGEEHRGIIPRSSDYIFRKVKQDSHIHFEVKLSFIEIYLDKLKDLFKADAPEVVINPEAERVELPGITEKTVSSTEEFMRWFLMGEKHRITRATNMNDTSSRGHAALLVTVSMTPKDDDGTMGTKIGKLVLVDLAGYERLGQTGITQGIALEEAKKINASLLALGSVVNALADAAAKKGGKQDHIPYRNAKLTRLLKDCLGGTSKTSIILTIGPCDKYTRETGSTFHFGWRAMAVKTNAQIKTSFDPAKYTASLKDRAQKATERIKSMVGWWSRTHPRDYKKYTESYGEPEVEMLDEDEEKAIEEAMKAQGATADAPTVMASPSRSLPPPAELLDELPPATIGGAAADSVQNVAVQQAVLEVKKEWGLELRHQHDQMQREEDALRMSHLKDLEDAKANGVSVAELDELKRLHREQMQDMTEANEALKGEILRQRNKGEVMALLTSSVENNPAQTDDNKRQLESMVTSLQETCDTKDDVVLQLLWTIQWQTEQITNHDAILAAQNELADDGDALKKAAKQVDELRSRIYFLEEELQRRPGGGAPRSGQGPTGELADLKTRCYLYSEQNQGLKAQVDMYRQQFGPLPGHGSGQHHSHTSHSSHHSSQAHPSAPQAPRGGYSTQQASAGGHTTHGYPAHGGAAGGRTAHPTAAPTGSAERPKEKRRLFRHS